MKEADLKRAVVDYLEIGQAQGRWLYLRLNSGSAFVRRGGIYYAIKLCEKGTSDFVVIKQNYFDLYNDMPYPASTVIFLELKSEKGRWSPEQRDFKVLVENQGCKYHLVRSIDELIKLLEGK